MSVLFVANTTAQIHEFCFRVPQNDGALSQNVRFQKILPGHQIKVGGGDLSSAQINKIIEQYQRYGMRDGRELSRAKGFIGLLYSVDKPVDLETIQGKIISNIDELEVQGDERRENTLTAIARNVSDAVGVEVKHAEVEIMEVGSVNKPDGGPQREAGDSRPALNVGAEYAAEGVTPRHPGAQKSARQRSNRN